MIHKTLKTLQTLKILVSVNALRKRDYGVGARKVTRRTGVTERLKNHVHVQRTTGSIASKVFPAIKGEAIVRHMKGYLTSLTDSARSKETSSIRRSIRYLKSSRRAWKASLLTTS